MLCSDVTAEEFISSSSSLGISTQTSSQYSRLRDQIASKLNIPVDNVDIFSVRDHPTLSRTVDVRYSAHGSPFYRQTRMDALLSLDNWEVVTLA